ncbi:MAG: hypothetical protein E7374_01670 [Clostridiales bacterium]|nr:hypothetical protein [Clostridiales bacterium]
MRMKNLLACVLCVIFICSINVAKTYCLSEEKIEFHYLNSVFVYNLEKNKKFSNQFDLNYEINKYSRFGTHEERASLLSKMLKAGIDLNIAMNYLFPNLDKTLDRASKNIEKQCVNATVKLNTEKENCFKIFPHQIGIIVDKEETYKLLAKKFLSNEEMIVEIKTCKIYPEILTEDIEKFTHLRGDFSTNISTSNTDRKHNIKNALNSLNRVKIYPNEVFSFNKTVGKRTKENGYREAKIIVNNEFVEGVGGGVCQVSSSLYNTALLSGLQIVEANKHSKQVGYVKHGFDAMVNFGSSDLKFRNNTNEILTIVTHYTPQKIRIRIFGESKANVEYKLTNEILSTVEPVEQVCVDTNGEYLDKVVYDDESFYLKTGSKGMHIKSYREKYVNGQFVSKELLREDKFPVQNAVKVVGAKKRIKEESTEADSLEGLKFASF